MKIFLLVAIIGSGANYQAFPESRAYTESGCIAEIQKAHYRAQPGKTWVCWEESDFWRNHK